MKTNYLLPHKYKTIGWILFVIGLTLGAMVLFAEFEPEFLNVKVYALFNEELLGATTFFSLVETNLLVEIIITLIVVGGLITAFTKEQIEDEFIAKIRLESLVWATYINYILLLLATLVVFELSFLYVMQVNMFTLLIFFIIRFNWMLRKSKKV